MWRFVLSRLLAAVPTLLAIVTLAFVLLRLAPGGPFDTEKEMPPEVRAQHRSASTTWMSRCPCSTCATWGSSPTATWVRPSSTATRSVNDLIAEGLPVDLTIGGLALLLACLVGIPLGALAAWRRGGVVDRAGRTACRCWASRCRSTWRRHC